MMRERADKRKRVDKREIEIRERVGDEIEMREGLR